ncbi:MAG: hypothetical protein AMS18_09360 [Gemmatimonas sp. SG8_17]|nr:MAG: hypothetical protein AMS18_09360 [Gemmatimonas sp. SG8_17]
MSLNDLKTSELVEMYNNAAEKLGEKTIKKFRDRDTALARTKEILSKVKPDGRSRTLDLPFLGNLHKIRPSSLRGEFLPHLEAGVTEAELQDITLAYDKEHGKKSKNVELRTRRTLLIMHRYNGYGFKQVGEKIFLVTE